MKNSRIITVTAALVALIAVAGIAFSSYATEDGFMGRWGKNKDNFDSEKRAAMMETQKAIKDAIENNDYAAWKELMSDNPMAENITEEDFAKLVEAYKLMQEGKYEEAKQIKEELGIKMWPEGKGMRGGFMMGGHRLEDKNGDGFCDHLDLEE